MMDILREFFGFGGYERPAEGFLSWQHLVFVSSFLAVIIVLAIYFGRKFRDKSYEEKNKVLIWTAIILDSIEIIRIIISCIRSGEPDRVLYELPLFLCSIQLIAIPVAAFSKGRLKEASLDFVFIFGMLGAVLGTMVRDRTTPHIPSFPLTTCSLPSPILSRALPPFTSASRV